MKRTVIFCLSIACFVALQGCNSGEISFEQQKSKKDALEKVAKKVEGPNFVQRPQ